MKKRKYSFVYRNSLAIVFLLLFFFSLFAQAYFGLKEHNDFLLTFGRPPESFSVYLCSGHFLQATFENWESEFLQMAVFVLLTVFLRQKGSSESKKLEELPKDHSDLKAKGDSPWPVKKGGIILKIYQHSLSLSLTFLFLISFYLHWLGSWIDHNEKQVLEGKAPVEMMQHLFSDKLWFESFQNWQSEFLSVLAIITLSIYFREHGSSQSKPVNASHGQTGVE